MKIGLSLFLLFSINHIVGFGFIQTSNQALNLGWLGIIVILIGAFISFTIALVYARGTKNFYQTGGSYVYAKKAYGAKNAFFQGWNQYVSSPLAGAAAPMFLYSILSDFGGLPNWAYRLISFSFFVIIILFTFIGFRKSSKLIIAIAFTKWIVLGLTLITGLILFSHSHVFATNMQHESVSISSFVASIISFFYAFGGMGSIAAMTTEVKNGKKNTSKILLITFLFAMVFYLVFFIVMSGAISKGQTSNASKVILEKTMGLTGVILFIIGIIFNRVSGVPSSIIATSRTLAPLAIDGYLPNFIAQKNKAEEYQNAITVDAILRIVFMFFLMFVPSWFGSSFSFITVINIWSISVFIQYIFTFITMSKLSRTQKIKKIPFAEQILYLLGSLMMIFAILVYFIAPVVGEQFEWITSEGQLGYSSMHLIQLGVYLIALASGFVIYFIQTQRKKYN